MFFVVCIGFFSEFFLYDEIRLLDEIIFVEFKGIVKEFNKFFYVYKIQYID